MMKQLLPIYEFIRKYGFSGLFKRVYYQLSDYYYEKHFHVHTTGTVLKSELGIDHEESVPYVPIPYQHIFQMLNRIPIAKNESTLLDYGCGKGRVLIAAASFNYKKIIGVELADIIKIADRNIKEMNRRKVKHIALEHKDATEFVVPGDVNIIYFFNPFFGSLLEKVVTNIHHSLQKAPRKMYVIYFNNDHFDHIIADKPWIKKVHQSEFYRDLTGAIYEIA